MALNRTRQTDQIERHLVSIINSRGRKTRPTRATVVRPEHKPFKETSTRRSNTLVTIRRF